MTTVPNTFKINGVSFSRQPTNHRWVNQNPFGLSGDGHASYMAFREYEMEFDFSSASEYNAFQSYFASVGLTGTVSVDLPEHPSTASVYQFRTYSGVIVHQPEYSSYHENFYESAKLLLVRIRTS